MNTMHSVAAPKRVSSGNPAPLAPVEPGRQGFTRRDTVLYLSTARRPGGNFPWSKRILGPLRSVAYAARLRASRATAGTSPITAI